MECPVCHYSLWTHRLHAVHRESRNVEDSSWMRTFTQSKKQLFWHEYHRINSRVDEGEFVEMLFRMGSSAHVYMNC
jgi:hypothetical protein